MEIHQLETDLALISHPADDLKQINGIGPAIETRLHAAGITCYTHLAAMTSEGLADLLSDFTGLTAERIEKKDWIGQAKRLQIELSTLKANPLPPSQDLHPQEMRQHYAVFTIELLLDENDRARRTRAMHVQSQQEKSWAGWDAARLIDFITSNAALHSSEARLGATLAPATPPPEVATQPSARLQASSPLLGALYVKDPTILAPSGRGVQHMIPAGKPFALRFGLDLRGVTALQDSMLNYSATLYVRGLGSRQRQFVGASSGSFYKDDHVDLQIGSVPLAHGLYRMEIIVFISRDDQEPGLGTGMAAMSDGGMLWVN